MNFVTRIQENRTMRPFAAACQPSGHGRPTYGLRPIDVVQSLPRALPAAEWSRQIPLALAGPETCSARLRIFEAAQAGAAIIAQATWDHGVLLAASVAHAW